ncbi:MAG: hypothetical protein J6R17_03465, partial [Bacteroidales bacterium]|nr:hypothetical protein [Bacteroidales bacterium]
MIHTPTDRQSTADPSCRQLIPLPPKTDASPKAAEAAPSAESHLFTFVCALFCILTVTVAGINLAAAAQRTSLSAIVRRLSDRAFLGCAILTVTDAQEKPPFPETEDTPPSDVTPPRDTETAEPSSGEIPPDDGRTEYPIEAADLSGSGSVHALFNETSYEPDTASLLTAALPFPDLTAHHSLYGENAPYILILHTHGTESFTP